MFKTTYGFRPFQSICDRWQRTQDPMQGKDDNRCSPNSMSLAVVGENPPGALNGTPVVEVLPSLKLPYQYIAWN